MDIQELANAYAKGRLSAIIEKVIAEIYSDGYHAGYKTKSDEIDEVILQKIAEAKAEVARAEAIKAAERAEEERLANEKAKAEKAEVERKKREEAEAKRIAEEEAETKRLAEEEAEEKKKAAKKKAENDKKDKRIKDVKFIDLGLPSGTLWAVESIGDMTFREAKKRYHLPTLEQFLELEREYLLSGDGENFRFLSDSGKVLAFARSSSDSYTYHFYFWLDEEENKKYACCADLMGYNNNSIVKLSTTGIFIGKTLPVMIVKSKE